MPFYQKVYVESLTSKEESSKKLKSHHEKESKSKDDTQMKEENKIKEKSGKGSVIKDSFPNANASNKSRNVPEKKVSADNQVQSAPEKSEKKQHKQNLHKTNNTHGAENKKNKILDSLKKLDLKTKQSSSAPLQNSYLSIDQKTIDRHYYSKEASSVINQYKQKVKTGAQINLNSIFIYEISTL